MERTCAIPAALNVPMHVVVHIDTHCTASAHLRSKFTAHQMKIFETRFAPREMEALSERT
jgi:hypothetical protein